MQGRQQFRQPGPRVLKMAGLLACGLVAACFLLAQPSAAFTQPDMCE